MCVLEMPVFVLCVHASTAYCNLPSLHLNRILFIVSCAMLTLSPLCECVNYYYTTTNFVFFTVVTNQWSGYTIFGFYCSLSSSFFRTHKSTTSSINLYKFLRSMFSHLNSFSFLFFFKYKHTPIEFYSWTKYKSVKK